MDGWDIDIMGDRSGPVVLLWIVLVVVVLIARWVHARYYETATSGHGLRRKVCVSCGSGIDEAMIGFEARTCSRCGGILEERPPLFWRQRGA